MAEALYSLHPEVKSESSSTQVCHSSTCFDFNRLKLRHKIANRIKAVRERFDAIAEERKFHLNERAIERGPVEDFTNYRETSSVVLEDRIYGRDMDKQMIVRILLNSASNKNNLLVYSIIGMGGLGKTTLAQYVYNDTNIEKYFQARIWVCVSEVFRAKKITKMIIESLSGTKCDLESINDLQNRLKELLSGKKFLLVLDDVWNEDQGNWDKLKFPLKCGAEGSSIIVTTRSSSVAQIMGALPMNQHKLTPLSDVDCWSLFKGRAFGGEVIENSEFERIGKEIVKKCGGVPLAAKALGGSLRSVREVNEWKSISNSEIWMLREDENDGGILPSLRLSYSRLSACLSQCFAFCAIFPKGHVINIMDLIQLWMANGLVQSEGTLDLEDVGRRTFNALVWRSFFQDLDRDYDGQPSCKMHDLMHDLACYVAENECLAFDGGDELDGISKSTRHFSTSPNSHSIEAKIKCLSNSHPFLRTFLLTKPFHYAMHDVAFENLRCLRVLDLSGTYIKYIPMSIGRLKHLRYLNLSKTGIVRLPSSLCDLKMLQTLKLRECYNLKTLPENMNGLVNLVHLDLFDCHKLTQMPLGIGEWVCLRTLGAFIVGHGNGQSIKELAKLQKLGGDLEIERLEHVRDAPEARVANLAAKTNLVGISFGWSWTSEQGNPNSEEVLEALQPHQGLSGCLSITNYRGSSFPSWIQNLEKLNYIKLIGCHECEDLPPLGHLPFLKRIEIRGMYSLKRINKEFYGTNSSSQRSFFPSLQLLELYTMPLWEEWEALDYNQVFPCLDFLLVYNCPNLALIPSTLLSSVRYLYLRFCEKMEVTSFPSLNHLNLSSFSSVALGSLQNLGFLRSLTLFDCTFISIPLQIENLISLKSLAIQSCSSLTSLSQSMQHLSTLETISIDNCYDLEFSSGDFHHLLALQTLNLVKLPKLGSLPDLQYLPTLQTLKITSCQNLRVLPQWLQNITSLRTLEIRACHDDLQVRCEEEKGEYWPYISYIPHYTSLSQLFWVYQVKRSNARRPNASIRSQY